MSKDLTFYFEEKIINDVLKRVPKAQYWLDSEIMDNMEPFMPKETDGFINLVRARNASLAGTGQVCIYTGPQGRFLYYGKKMMNSKTFKGPRVIPIGGGEVIFRWPYGSTLIPTNEPLEYTKTKNPLAGPFWFDKAKERYLKHWREGVIKILNGE